MSKKFFISTFLLSSLFILSPFTIHAQTQPGLTPYKLLEPLPGIETTSGSGTTNAGAYLAGIFQLALALAGVLAVLRLIYAGTVYMTTDAFGKKGEAKKVIQEALLGLGLAIGAWLILALVLSPNCQNGNAFCFNLSLGQPIFSTQTNTNAPGTSGGGPGPQASGLTQADVASQFQNAGVAVAGNVQLTGLQQKTIDEVVSLKQECNCDVTVTSATGGSHAAGDYSHANGYKIDLRLSPSLTNYITSTFSTGSLVEGNKSYVNGNTTYVYELIRPASAPISSWAPHWDVTVK